MSKPVPKYKNNNLIEKEQELEDLEEELLEIKRKKRTVYSEKSAEIATLTRQKIGLEENLYKLQTKYFSVSNSKFLKLHEVMDLLFVLEKERHDSLQGEVRGYEQNRQRGQQDLENLRASLSRSFTELSEFVGFTDHEKILNLEREDPEAALLYHTMFNVLVTCLDVYLSLSTGKIAFSDDKTAQVAQLVGKGVDLLPLVGGVGGIVEAAVVFENGRRKEKRAKRAFHAFGNSRDMFEVVRMVCLQIAIEFGESVRGFTDDDVIREGFRMAKILQRSVTSGKVYYGKFTNAKEKALVLFQIFKKKVLEKGNNSC